MLGKLLFVKIKTKPAKFVLEKLLDGAYFELMRPGATGKPSQCRMLACCIQMAM